LFKTIREHFSGSNTFSLSTTLSGSNTLQVRVQDLAGKAAPAYTHSYTVDTQAPVIGTITEVSNNATNTLAKAGDVITATFTSPDTVSGVTIGGHAATVAAV